MTWLWWAVSALGGLGVIGFIVLAVFFPPLLLTVWKVTSSGFMWFFRTRIGFGIVVGLAVWYGTSWYQHKIDTEACEAEKVAFKAAQKQLASDIKKDAEAFVRKEIADEFMAQQESDDAVAAFKKALDPADVCHIGADAPKLRALTISGRPQNRNHNRVRKAPARKVVP